MLFNSLTYLIFFPIICILYWCIPFKYRNAILLIASYYFYMSWKPKYIILIIITLPSTLKDIYWCYNTSCLVDYNNKYYQSHPELFYDTGHVNKFGADMYTRKISSYLSQL